ncbi:DUF1302 family protein [Deltaproteobacteria bacterium TL4]
MNKPCLLALLLLLTVEAPLWAGDFDDAGFDLEVASPSLTLDPAVVVSPKEAPSPLAFYGFGKSEVGYSYERDHDRLSKFRQTVNLTLDYKDNPDLQFKISGNGYHDLAYGINGRDHYTQETLDGLEREYELRDTYLDANLGAGFLVRAGRQIIAWGQSDAAQLNDMANPRDNRELGLVDLEDARIPVASTKLTWTNSVLEINLVGIHEFRANKLAPKGSEFDPLVSLRASGVEVASAEIPTDTDGYLARVLVRYNGGDAALYYSETYSDSFYLDFESFSPNPSGGQLTLQPKYKKVKSFGISGNQVFGSLLLKGEFAQKQGMAYARTDTKSQIMALMTQGLLPQSGNGQVQTWAEKDLTQGMLGLEYMGITDLTLSAEGIFEQINDWNDTLSASKNSGMSYSSVNYAALNDTLHTRFVWVHFFDSDGEVYRLNVDYDLIDALNLSAGWVTYNSTSTEALIEPFKKNDRLLLAAKYSF